MIIQRLKPKKTQSYFTNIGDYTPNRVEYTLIQSVTSKPAKKIGITDFLPDGMFANRHTPYFVPTKIKRYDYAINIFRDLINELRNDWFQEYKPVLAKIKTPQEVSESIRLNEMMFTSDPDDLDEI